MSLLIKALASAEKDKQAEQNKRQASEPAAATLALELAPMEIKSVAISGSLDSDGATKDLANVSLATSVTESSLTEIKQAEPDSLNDSFADSYLSLAEEAGLTDTSLTASKYIKPKATAAKASSKANDQFNLQKDNLQAVQQAKKANNKAATSLSAASSLQSVAAQATETNQKAAAKVFVANQAVKSASSKSALVALGIAGALMIWLGLQGYTYFNKLTAPVLVVAKPALPTPPVVAVVPAGNVVPTENVASIDQAPAETSVLPRAISAEIAVVKDAVKSAVEPSASQGGVVAENDAPKKVAAKKSKSLSDEFLTENELLVNRSSESASQNASKRAPVKLISRVPTAGVDPTLLAAYQAFSRGEYATAQQQYRQVLQSDIRNVDALLGMAAIAQRQGRDADAQGWYQKVLEIEPRNIIAQSAIVSTQANTDVIGTESRIKSMLAQQPEAANLHASLGNLYAEQSQWPSAQEAFFNACRFAPNNADYVFNLAISLDQMGKSNLALKQYQRALEMVNKSGATSPDKAQLEARIRALQ